MLVVRHTCAIALSLALLVLLGLAFPHPTAASVWRAGSGRRLKTLKASVAAADNGRRRDQEEATAATTYIQPNEVKIDDIDADMYESDGGFGKGGSCGGPYQMCCSDAAARCVPGYGCNYDPEIPNPEESNEKDGNVTYPPYTCTPCGGDDEPCCKTSCSAEECESECMEGGCNLFTNKCESCGALDNVCCPGDRCPGANSTIDEVLLCNTDANRCEACGRGEEQCCPGDVCADGNLACNTVTGLCEICGTEPGDICCSGNKCPFGDDGMDETDDRLSCNTAAFPPTCERCGEFGGPCCPVEDFPLPCDLDGAFSCNANGRCPDIGDEDGDPPSNTQCRLENGKDGAREMRATGGCAIWTEGGTLDPINCLCCKGQCNKGPVTEDGYTFMYCSGGKMGADEDCEDIPEGSFPPAPGGTPPDATAPEPDPESPPDTGTPDDGSDAPSNAPTPDIASSSPTLEESSSPSVSASNSPSVLASSSPTIEESSSPSVSASNSPSVVASSVPTLEESSSPSVSASNSPSVVASSVPTVEESSSPSVTASTSPSVVASSVPTVEESSSPSVATIPCSPTTIGDSGGNCTTPANYCCGTEGGGCKNAASQCEEGSSCTNCRASDNYCCPSDTPWRINGNTDCVPKFEDCLVSPEPSVAPSTTRRR